MNIIKGYKAFNPDFTCRDYQFSENSEHKIDGEPILCKQGFHFCTDMADCFNYYPFDKDIILCEVEALGQTIADTDDAKHATNHIKILNRVNMTFDEILNECSNNKDWIIRRAVAKNTNTSIELLIKLSDDKNGHVRKLVAENPNTSSDTLDKLSDDDDAYVRHSAARNPNYIK
jgi:3-methyladenine DNA glycosylase AlkC